MSFGSRRLGDICILGIWMKAKNIWQRWGQEKGTLELGMGSWCMQHTGDRWLWKHRNKLVLILLQGDPMVSWITSGLYSHWIVCHPKYPFLKDIQSCPCICIQPWASEWDSCPEPKELLPKAFDSENSRKPFQSSLLSWQGILSVGMK